MGGSPIIFIDTASMLIVLGGTVGATLVRNPLDQVIRTFKIAAQTLSGTTVSPDVIIDRILELASKARKEGILSLEDEPIDYTFLEKAVGYCVDGIKEDDVRAMMMNDLRSTAQRHRRGQEILKGMGQAAPAFGMIGTLIGLVKMLAAMNDPSQIGPSMALALLTTLYGAILANVFCLPMADKLKVRSEQEQLTMVLCIEGVLGLARGINPKALNQQLAVFLANGAKKQKSGPEPVHSDEAAA